jgi:hypothetical protein
VAVLLWFGLNERSDRQRAEAALTVERTLFESRETLRAELDKVRLTADAQRAGIEAVRKVVEVITRVEEAAAEEDIRRAAQDAKDVDDEFARTGRVTESMRKFWRDLQLKWNDEKPQKP